MGTSRNDAPEPRTAAQVCFFAVPQQGEDLSGRHRNRRVIKCAVRAEQGGVLSAHQVLIEREPIAAKLSEHFHTSVGSKRKESPIRVLRHNRQRDPKPKQIGRDRTAPDRVPGPSTRQIHHSLPCEIRRPCLEPSGESEYAYRRNFPEPAEDHIPCGHLVVGRISIGG